MSIAPVSPIMRIKALPDAATRLLGSSQVLTTPISLVKELVDNSLDAKATYVDILISQNTIDKIEVRDNGHGIGQEDLAVLGRRGYTSKLRSLEELRGIGRTSLGFRGEALASAIELGEVSVTTRTDGELIATIVKLKAPGGIEHQAHTSHPIGTTICVSKLMDNLPVRKKTALKDASKTLSKIKELLHAYALARPSIRFNLRVAGGNKGAWSFAPRPNDGIREAVSNIVGKDAAMQCVMKSMVFPKLQGSAGSCFGATVSNASSSLESVLMDRSQYFVEAFLPKPDSDPSKIGSGQYLLVDSRPMSHEKGTMKKINTIFKKYVRAALAVDSVVILKNPFIRLNITCPIGSYDPNVEPAKDAVIFENESLILQSVEELLKDIYGDCNTKPSESPSMPLNENPDNFNLLVNRKDRQPEAKDTLAVPAATSVITQSHRYASVAKEVEAKGPAPIREGLNATTQGDIGALHTNKRQRWDFSMSKHYTEDTEGFKDSSLLNQLQISSSTPRSFNELQSTSTSPLNPWVLAKINAPIQEVGVQDEMTTSGIYSDEGSRSALRFVPIGKQRPGPSLSVGDALLSPTNDVARKRVRNVEGQGSESLVPNLSNHSIQDTRHALCSQANRQSQAANFNEPVGPDGDQAQHLGAIHGFIVARDVPGPLMLSPPATQNISSQKRPKRPNRPFVSPVKFLNSTTVHDRLHQTKLSFDHQLSQKQNATQDQPQREQNADLVWAMDFEQRKEDATRRRQEELRSSRIETGHLSPSKGIRPSPHKNRYNTAVAGIETRRRNEISVQYNGLSTTSLLDGDPRAYLMTWQKSISAQGDQPERPLKQKLMKTSLLPLETVPESEYVCNLIYTISTDAEGLRRAMVAFADYDAYASCGNQATGLATGLGAEDSFFKRVEDVVKRWMQSDKTKNYDVEFNFSNLLSAEVVDVREYWV